MHPATCRSAESPALSPMLSLRKRISSIPMRRRPDPRHRALERLLEICDQGGPPEAGDLVEIR